MQCNTRRNTRWWVLAVVLLACQSAMAGLAILAEGRVQPVSVFADRIEAKWSETGSGNAINLFRIALNPRENDSIGRFRLDREDVRQALQLPAGKRRFSYNEMLSVRYTLESYAERVRADSDPPDAFDRSMLRLSAGMADYETWRKAVEPLRPSPDFVAKGLPDTLWRRYARDTLSALQVADLLPDLLNADAHDTVGQRLVARFFLYVRSWPADPVRIWPVTSGAWLSLGDMLAPLPDSSQRQLRRLVAKVAPEAYFASAAAWQESMPLDMRRVVLFEDIYHDVAPFRWAGWLSLLSCATWLAFRRGRSGPLRFAPAALLFASMIMVVAGFSLRFLVAARPPVASLFESLLGVDLLVLLGGLLARRKFAPVLPLSGAVSVLLIVLAEGWAKSGDTLGVLQPVLDSSLWLTVHVLAMIFGYTGILVAAVLAHVWLWQCSKRIMVSPQVGRLIFASLAWGLTFTFGGTVLGGIWADQSWGRFWGWDPKENGALFLILWMAILFHAKGARLIGERGMALGAMAGGIWLALVWFGVNMLGQGLHSYGNAAQGIWLGAFCSMEGVLLLWFSRKTQGSC